MLLCSFNFCPRDGTAVVGPTAGLLEALVLSKCLEVCFANILLKWP